MNRKTNPRGKRCTKGYDHDGLGNELTEKEKKRRKASRKIAKKSRRVNRQHYQGR